MNKFTLCLALIIFGFTAHAGHSIMISNPQGNWNNHPGSLTEVMMEVTPMGAFAEVALTFKVNAPGNFSVSDSLEATIDFELPTNSYFHNSWLWLDNNTIIQAAIIEKSRAVAIYEGIVKRRRDPSLLTKTGPSSYRLQIFPMTTAYPRKVKIIYSVPINWINGNVNLQLPTALLNASVVKPDFLLRIRQDNAFPVSYPAISNNVMLVSSNPSERVYMVYSGAYASMETLVRLHPTLTNGMLLTDYPTGVNEGIYQLVVDPSASFGAAQARNMNFILDHQSVGYGDIHNWAAVKKHLHGFLRSQLGPLDSFNIFYVDGSGTVSSVFSTWQPADSINTELAISSLPAQISPNNNKFEDLLKSALAFTQTKPGIYAQSMIISNNKAYTVQALTDTLHNRLVAHLGGFTNKVHVLNNNSANMGGTPSLTASELLWSKLTLATGGFHHKYVSSGNTATVDVPGILTSFAQHTGYNLNTFALALPVNSGFAYSRFDIGGLDRMSTSLPYVETGKYVGSLDPSGNVSLQALTASGMINSQISASAIQPALINSKLTWVHLYIRSMAAQSNNAFINEIIDSSLRNRVMCDYTAFLALETGDTVNESKNEHSSSGGGPSSVEPFAKDDEVKAYPNPFTTEITIEFDEVVTTITCYDLSGRLVFTHIPGKTDRRFIWNGRNMQHTPVPAGIYILKLQTSSGVRTVKLIRQ